MQVGSALSAEGKGSRTTGKKSSFRDCVSCRSTGGAGCSTPDWCEMLSDFLIKGDCFGLLLQYELKEISP